MSLSQVIVSDFAITKQHFLVVKKDYFFKDYLHALNFFVSDGLEDSQVKKGWFYVFARSSFLLKTSPCLRRVMPQTVFL